MKFWSPTQSIREQVLNRNPIHQPRDREWGIFWNLVITIFHGLLVTAMGRCYPLSTMGLWLLDLGPTSYILCHSIDLSTNSCSVVPLRRPPGCSDPWTRGISEFPCEASPLPLHNTTIVVLLVFEPVTVQLYLTYFSVKQLTAAIPYLVIQSSLHLRLTPCFLAPSCFWTVRLLRGLRVPLST